MNTEPTKLPMRKILEFLYTEKSVSTQKEFNEFWSKLHHLVRQLEVEELALLGDAHYDGMCEMKELIENQNLLENTNGYIKEKFDKELPDVDGEVDNTYLKKQLFKKFIHHTFDMIKIAKDLKKVINKQNEKDIVYATIAPPIHDGNALFDRVAMHEKLKDLSKAVKEHAPTAEEVIHASSLVSNQSVKDQKKTIDLSGFTGSYTIEEAKSLIESIKRKIEETF